MATFTEKETKLLTACMKFMTSDASSCIDFDKVAIDAGYKDAKNAKVMFSRLKKTKLDGAIASAPGVGADKVSKSSTKKTSGGPRKASTSASKTGGVKGGKSKTAAAVNGEAATKAGEVDDGEVEANSGEDQTQATTQVEGGEGVIKEEGNGSGYDSSEIEKVNGFTAINHAMDSGDEES